MFRTVLRVDGMMCSMCEAHVNDAIRRSFDVKKVTSSHMTGETVIITEAPADTGKLCEAVNKTGYSATLVSTGKYEKKGLFGRK